MVKEIILDNDRVVLPGLGSFVAELVPSTFSDKGYTINPPYRRLYFRAKPDKGSEIADFYSKSNKVDIALAEKIIIDFVAELKSILHTKKTIVFPGLGRLRATKENNVFFIADEDLDIYPAGFGLEPVSLKTHQETSEEVSAAVVGLKSLLEDPLPVPEHIQTAPEPEPIPEQELTPEPTPTPETTSAIEPTPEPLVEIPVPELAQEPEPAQEPALEHVSQDKPKGRLFLKIVIVLTIIALVSLVAFAIVGRLCPEWIDGFLYSPEELRILNYRL